MKKTNIIMLMMLVFSGVLSAQTTNDMNPVDTKDALVEFKTTMGDIVVELYNDTPLHRDNFLKLVKDGVYEGLLFHRVINQFMVQGGDPSSKDAAPGQMLGSGDLGYTVQAEIKYPTHYHKYGALSAARTGDMVNPERRSSASQFYIVTGRQVSEQMLEQAWMKQYQPAMQQELNRLAKENADTLNSLREKNDREGFEALKNQLIKEAEKNVDIQPVPEKMKADYLANGGAPHLDGEYTVYGEVIKGMDIVEKIQKVETDSHDRPLEDIRILSAKIIKEPDM